MKEATGELSTTVIAVVAIAGIAALFSTLLLPYLRGAINSRMHCASAINCDCTAGKGTCSCEYVDDNGDLQNVTCDNPDKDGKSSGSSD